MPFSVSSTPLPDHQTLISICNGFPTFPSSGAKHHRCLCSYVCSRYVSKRWLVRRSRMTCKHCVLTPTCSPAPRRFCAGVPVFGYHMAVPFARAYHEDVVFTVQTGDEFSSASVRCGGETFQCGSPILLALVTSDRKSSNGHPIRLPSQIQRCTSISRGSSLKYFIFLSVNKPCPLMHVATAGLGLYLVPSTPAHPTRWPRH